MNKSAPITANMPKIPIAKKDDTILCEHYSREITILSDGDVTTCCVDNMGLNRFANIYEHSLEETMIRHRESKRNFVNQPKKTPACLACLRNWTVRPYMYTDDEAAIERFENDVFLPDQFVLEVTSRCNAQCMTCITIYLRSDPAQPAFLILSISQSGWSLCIRVCNECECTTMANLFCIKVSSGFADFSSLKITM